MYSLRKEVLKSFKNIHKARKYVFKDDDVALEASRKRINEEYRKNKHVNDTSSIEQLIKLSYDVANELKTTVLQAKKVKDDTYEVRITPETHKLDNIPEVPLRKCRPPKT